MDLIQCAYRAVMVTLLGFANAAAVAQVTEESFANTVPITRHTRDRWMPSADGTSGQLSTVQRVQGAHHTTGTEPRIYGVRGIADVAMGQYAFDRDSLASRPNTGAPWIDPTDTASYTAYSGTPQPVGCVAYNSPEAKCGQGSRLQAACSEFWSDLCTDHRNYYSWNTLGDFLVALGGGAILANTSLDDDFQSWYQRDVRSQGTDRHAAFWKTFGEGQIFIPAFLGLAVAGTMCEHAWPVMGIGGEFGERVTRGYVVGAPSMLLMQFTLGGSRPDETSVGSQWKPFDDTNAVSGHAFMGAVPFITAAKMTDNRLAKCTLYACSTFTAWSRVNDHDHYLSQACLGWYMAYLACRAVDLTENGGSCYTITPMVAPNTMGLAVIMER